MVSAGHYTKGINKLDHTMRHYECEFCGHLTSDAVEDMLMGVWVLKDGKLVHESEAPVKRVPKQKPPKATAGKK